MHTKALQLLYAYILFIYLKKTLTGASVSRTKEISYIYTRLVV